MHRLFVGQLCMHGELAHPNPHTQLQSHPNIPSDDRHTEPDKDNLGGHLKAGLSLLGHFFVWFLMPALSKYFIAPTSQQAI
jgi:hypothetical protein